MSTIKTLRLLARVRERQSDRIQSEIQRTRSQLSDLESRLGQAQQAHESAARQEQMHMDALDHQMNTGFTSDSRLAIDAAIREAAVVRQGAKKELDAAEKALSKQADIVARLEADLRRNQQKEDRLREQIREALVQADVATEDAAEEEAEEAGNARWVRANRSSDAERVGAG
ncbi:MAG: hypothetical protein ACK40L_00815 [Hydrogenophaga sp.]